MESASETRRYFLHAVLYSKDRPFQVQQLLKSMDLFIFNGYPVQIKLADGRESGAIKLACSTDKIEVIVKQSVFYTYTAPEFGQLFDQLIPQFTHYDFVLEDRATNLEQILSLIKDTKVAGYTNFF